MTDVFPDKRQGMSEAGGLNRPLRVLLILHELTLTGAPRVIIDAFEAFNKADVETQIATRSGGAFADRARQIGPLLIKYDRDASTDLPSGYMGYARRTIAVLRRDSAWRRGRKTWGRAVNRPDLIYVNTVAAFPILREALQVMRRGRPSGAALPPVLLHVHELPSVADSLVRGYDEEFKRVPAHVIAASEAVKDALVSRYDFSPEKISVIHEFVGDPVFKKGRERLTRTKPVGPDAPLVIGGAGTPINRKAPYWWLQMAQRVAEILGRDSVRFVWVGVPDNGAGDEFHELARLLKIDDLIDFVAPTPDPFSHFARFDLFAQTAWEDPCPIVVLENMAFGNPVLCFANSGGAPEEVGETGIVIPDFSPVKMAEAAANLARDPERMAQMGRDAQARVAERFLDRVQTPKILRVMQEAAATVAKEPR